MVTVPVEHPTRYPIWDPVSRLIYEEPLVIFTLIICFLGFLLVLVMGSPGVLGTFRTLFYKWIAISLLPYHESRRGTVRIALLVISAENFRWPMP
jgi:hypothetical protein